MSNDSQDNVVKFTGLTRLKLSPDDILSENIGELESVVIMGYHKDGSEFFASSDPDAAFCMFMAERLKQKLHRIMDNLDED